MKIVFFHPSVLPAPHYGGTERVLIWLARGLQARGHEVWISAYPESRLPEGIQFIPVEKDRSSAKILLEKNFLPSGTEIVHFMAPPEKGVIEKLQIPSIVTVHGNGKSFEVFPKNSVFLSQNHATRHGAESFVYNGLDPDEYEFLPETKTNEYLFLSKTSWKVKNLKGAMKVCDSACVPLVIAGGNRPVSLRIAAFLRNQTRPEKFHWIGSVGGKKKQKALTQAKAFLFPVRWPEPFGLAVIEALVSGTPVLASPHGSLPEIVTPDVGALLDTHPQWVRALKRENLPWSPHACRNRVLEKFHYLKMAENYEFYYQKILQGHPLHSRHPKAEKRTWIE